MEGLPDLVFFVLCLRLVIELELEFDVLLLSLNFLLHGNHGVFSLLDSFLHQGLSVLCLFGLFRCDFLLVFSRFLLLFYFMLCLLLHLGKLSLRLLNFRL